LSQKYLFSEFGELTFQGAVMDEVVNILNDDKVVAAGYNSVKQGERVLGAFEGVSGNKVADDKSCRSRNELVLQRTRLRKKSKSWTSINFWEVTDSGPSLQAVYSTAWKLLGIHKCNFRGSWL
jgi:hypothetical protein